MISMHYITLYVIETLSSPKKSLGFGKFGLRKYVPVSIKFASEKGLGFGIGKFGLRVKMSRFRSKFWSRYSVVEGQSRRICYTTCSERKNTITDGGSTALCCGAEWTGMPLYRVVFLLVRPKND